MVIETKFIGGEAVVEAGSVMSVTGTVREKGIIAVGAEVAV